MSQYATIQNNLIATHHILICKARAIVQSKTQYLIAHTNVIMSSHGFDALLYNQCY